MNEETLLVRDYLEKEEAIKFFWSIED